MTVGKIAADEYLSNPDDLIKFFLDTTKIYGENIMIIYDDI